MLKMLMDPTRSTLWLSNDEEWSRDPDVVTYASPDAAHVVLDGRVDGAPLVVRLKRIEPSQSLLVSRGFHWIQEFPFNR